MKKIAILQSNYIPWKGYFDLINMVDEFVLYDDMQYTKRDWRNRNKIKTPKGPQWLSIPVEVKGRYFQKISETKISDQSWKKKHWGSIVANYSKTKHFKEYNDLFEELYLNNSEDHLSLVNYNFIIAINKILGIQTKIRRSSEFNLVDGQTEKLIQICTDCNASTYLSGPAAREYFDYDVAKNAEINVEWMDYSGYLEYDQRFPPFEHGVTILDLIFNEGPNAQAYMKSFCK